MKSIAELDSNFQGAPVERDGLFYQGVRQTKAAIYGLYKDTWYRLPLDICAGIGPRLEELNWNTSGGRVRFKMAENARRIGIRAKTNGDGFLPHMPLSGTSSIDVYLENPEGVRYFMTLRPDGDNIEGTAVLPEAGMTVRLYMPLYNGLEWLEIGTEAGQEVEAPAPYGVEKPVVFYGSSITQGGCATRPGNSYPALLERALNSDFINLGFSGNAMGDPTVAEYISGLEMSCFVYDYDYNAPGPEHLEKTHRPFLEQILRRQPELPVIMVTRPNPSGSQEDFRRREVILNTYKWAFEAGYKVQFVDGWTMFGVNGRDCCTVDGVHPNDLGFYRMAEAILPILSHFLGSNLPMLNVK